MSHFSLERTAAYLIDRVLIPLLLLDMPILYSSIFQSFYDKIWYCIEAIRIRCFPSILIFPAERLSRKKYRK